MELQFQIGRKIPQLLLFALSFLASTTLAENSEVVFPLVSLASATSYVVDFNIGSAQKPMRLIIDSGSSNDAVIKYRCAESETCQSMGTRIEVKYAASSISGTLVRDDFFHLPKNQATIKISGVEFIDIEKEDGFAKEGFQGILGGAYSSLARPQDNIPETVYDRIRLARPNTKDIYGLLLCSTYQTLFTNNISDPRSEDSRQSGLWSIGGVDGENGEKFHSGPIKYSPVVEEKWYVLVMTDLGFGDASLKIPCQNLNTPHAIVDSGTTNVVLPPDIYQVVIANLKQQVARLGLTELTFSDSMACCPGINGLNAACDPRDPNSRLFEMPAMFFSFASENEAGDTNQIFTVTIPPEYIWRPVVQEKTRGCRVFGISEGDSLVLGTVFMDGLYTVHDRENRKVGFGVADNCPNNLKSTKTISAPMTVEGQNWCECLSEDHRTNSELVGYFPNSRPCFFWQWWMYVVIACTVVIFASFLVVCVSRYQKRKKKKKRINARPFNRPPGQTPQLYGPQPGQNATQEPGLHYTNQNTPDPAQQQYQQQQQPNRPQPVQMVNQNNPAAGPIQYQQQQQQPYRPQPGQMVKQNSAAARPIQYQQQQQPVKMVNQNTPGAGPIQYPQQQQQPNRPRQGQMAPVGTGRRNDSKPVANKVNKSRQHKNMTQQQTVRQKNQNTSQDSQKRPANTNKILHQKSSPDSLVGGSQGNRSASGNKENSLSRGASDSPPSAPYRSNRKRVNRRV